MNAGAVDQSIAIAMQSVTHAARPADTASCAASSQVSLVGPAGSLPTQAWNWSMQPPSRSVAATFKEPAHRITFQRRRRAPVVCKTAFLVRWMSPFSPRVLGELPLEFHLQNKTGAPKCLNALR